MSEAIVAHGELSAAEVQARRSRLPCAGGRSARQPFRDGSHQRL